MSLGSLRGKARVAAALSAIEANFDARETADLLDEAFSNPKGLVTGITGPPGAGKSTLIDAMLADWRKAGQTVAVFAVDPSSRATGGALLGDRVRMRADPDDEGVLIRSAAARGRLGGLSSIAYPAAVLLRALYDRVIVESVGVGQSETDIATVADTVVLCIQPASGDSLQFMKAGIAEIPDIAVVTKADMGAAATRALADLKGALSLAHRDKGVWEPECLSVSVTQKRESVGHLFAAFSRREAWLASENRLARQREAQARIWLRSEIEAAFGARGLALADETFSGVFNALPFSSARRALAEFAVIRRPFEDR